MTHQTKAYPITGFKALDQEGQGIFEAIVAVFGNVDKVGDRIMPGAFTKSLEMWQEKGRPIPVIFSHDWGNLDAHIGEVITAEERDEGLYVKGQLDLEEEFASRVWKKLQRGTLAEFSFAYDEVDTEWVEGVHELRALDIYEVGPCLVGMNPATQLLGLKRALASHSTATTDAAWDGPANEARARSDENEAYYRRIFAWRDPDGDAAVKASYKFVHHMVGQGGDPGAANVRACQTGIGVLNGGRGGTTIPDADRQGVYAHLARHLRDADVEPPELKSAAMVRLEAVVGQLSKQLATLAQTLGQAGEGEGEGEGEGQGQTGDGELRSQGPSTLAARVELELLEIGAAN